jgi:rhodanese-related sulfurtransferase
MASYRDLLAQTKSEISELDATQARALDGAVWVDVRELDEWQEGHLPGAVHVPRGFLESRIETVAPDKEQPVVLYCASAARSAFAAKSLSELGYASAHSLAGGFTDWKRNGLEVVMPRTLSPERRTRYSRHLLIPEIGEEGQLKLLDARILGSSMQTSSTRRTSSGRSRTRWRRSASRRSTPRSARSTRSIPT